MKKRKIEKNENFFFKGKFEKMEKWKKWKNEKKRKMEENDEKRKKNEKYWIHTQNPRRFYGFTVVVVTFFVKILDDFHDFVFGMCLFPEDNQQPVLGR